MAKSNKLLMKLIRASGGWENFLYETLKEIPQRFDDFGEARYHNDDLVQEIQEIIEAYEEQQGVANSISCEKLLEIQKHNIKLTPTLETKDIIKSVPPLPAQPLKKTAKIGVDTDAGWSQGQLPLPVEYRIVNKGQLNITTVTGMELGRGSDDGQIRGQDVSGQISNYGKYRLVFKDVHLGAAFINFEIAPIPPAPIDTRPLIPMGQVQITPAMIAVRDAEMKTAKEASAAATKAVAEVVTKAVPVDPLRPKGGVKEVG